MYGVSVRKFAADAAAVPVVHRRYPGALRREIQNILLLCGIASSLFYVGITVFVAMQSPGYSSMSQTISELSAIGAPTRNLWVWLATGYTVLVIAFGAGVW